MTHLIFWSESSKIREKGYLARAYILVLSSIIRKLTTVIIGQALANLTSVNYKDVDVTATKWLLKFSLKTHLAK